MSFTDLEASLTLASMAACTESPSAMTSITFAIDMTSDCGTRPHSRKGFPQSMSGGGIGGGPEWHCIKPVHRRSAGL